MISFLLIAFCMITFAPETVNGEGASCQDLNLEFCELQYVCKPALTTTVPTTTTTTVPTTTTISQFETKCNEVSTGSGFIGRTKFIWNSCLIGRGTALYADAATACASTNPADQFRNGHLVILDTPDKLSQFKNVLIQDWEGLVGWTFFISSTSQSVERPYYTDTGIMSAATEYWEKPAICQYDADRQ